MGTIRMGFWKSRFLIAPDEFNSWIDLWEENGFYTEKQNSPHNLKQQYEGFYRDTMDSLRENENLPWVCGLLVKDNFQSVFHLISKELSFHPKDKPVVQRKMFVELSAPKQYAVVTGDGIHFTYEDILQKEPQAYHAYKLFNTAIKKITKPLYYQERPAYSVRISKQAYSDLQNSAFIKGNGAGLSSKW